MSDLSAAKAFLYEALHHIEIRPAESLHIFPREQSAYYLVQRSAWPVLDRRRVWMLLSSVDFGSDKRLGGLAQNPFLHEWRRGITPCDLDGAGWSVRRKCVCEYVSTARLGRGSILGWKPQLYSPYTGMMIITHGGNELTYSVRW